MNDGTGKKEPWDSPVEGEARVIVYVIVGGFIAGVIFLFAIVASGTL